MLRLEIERSPLREHHISQTKSFEAVLKPIIGAQHRLLHLSFDTGADGQRASCYTLLMGSTEFAELARMMVEVDPVAAVHAFGAAMQNAEIERRLSTEGTDAEAA